MLGIYSEPFVRQDADSHDGALVRTRRFEKKFRRLCVPDAHAFVPSSAIDELVLKVYESRYSIAGPSLEALQWLNFAFLIWRVRVPYVDVAVGASAPNLLHRCNVNHRVDFRH